MKGKSSTSLSLRGLKPIQELAASRPHGDRIKYMSGCRCVPCKAANSRYETMRLAARKNGDWNGLVPATRARRHINKLSKKGVGRRAIAAASDVADSVIHAVKTGRKLQIRKRTETRILAVTAEAVGDAALVSAKRTWVLIERLLDQGFSKAEIARRMGKKTPNLRFRKDRVTTRTASQVERFYRRMME